MRVMEEMIMDAFIVDEGDSKSSQQKGLGQ